MHPQRYRRHRQRDAERRVTARRKGPVERGTQIVDPPGVFAEPFGRGSNPPFRFGPLEQVPIVFRVAPCDPFSFSVLAKLFERVSTCGIEQSITRDGTLDVAHNQRLCDQAGKAVDRVQLGEVQARRYRSSSLQTELTSEDGEATQQDALGLGEQSVAPVERPPQRLLARQRGPSATG